MATLRVSIPNDHVSRAATGVASGPAEPISGTASKANLATPDPAQPPPPASSPRAPGWLLLPGFGILVACLLAGEGVKRALHLILPGNILGLFILLALLAAGIVPLRWMEVAARWLLFLLPLLFVPIFVLALKKAAQLPQSTGFFAAVAGGVLLLWASVGHLAQAMLSRRPPGETETKRTTP